MGRLLRTVLFFLFCFTLATGLILTRSDSAMAEMPVPPVLGLKLPPELVPLPDINVYVIHDFDMDIAFYDGWWWRLHDGRWYKAADYNGAWGLVITRKVPEMLFTLPPGFRRNGLTGTRIPYGQLKKNWKRWGKEKRWTKGEKKTERRDEKRGDKQERDGRGQGHGGGKGKK